MTFNHLSQGIQNNVAKGDAFREGYGFGLGVLWNDPQVRLVVVVGTAAPGALVYGAMTESYPVRR
jgi:hypothetical protein